ncbi:Ig-like and fibronectin type-III domain-containing protein 1 [Mercenaria mercenaria]|uniref:Ig-like and fibronectin type-III domain-containing protein 1 n=1 Tax=Mercenaria mercenaria TaxID=6596 RepID=UPI00234F07DF|nr:Ig-like and fibronectin type-III domain-containing protein 1 [Mercenaria mercenaria]
MMKTITDQVFLILAIILPVFCQTKIETASQTVTKTTGQTAQFNCKVTNLQPSQTVIWEFVDHNQTISVGNKIHAGNEHLDSKYTISRPQDGGDFWNLEINNVDLTDKGSYKCYVSGTSAKVTHHLEITDAPEDKPVPDLNVTAFLPSPPTGVSAVSSGTALLVTWQPPLDNLDVVVGYKIQYKKKGAAVFNSTKSLPSDLTVSTLDNLELNEVYEIQVVALANSGASQPSLPIYKATGEVIPVLNYTQTIKDCCKDKNISLGCQDYCDASMYYTGGDPNMLQCTSELDVIYQCIAGHGDHTPCCKRNQVPEACFGFCRGEPNLSWSSVQCLNSMNVIATCVVEGHFLLPDPPQNTRILAETVTSSSAVVAWDPPDTVSAQTVDHYLVSWKIDKETIPNWTGEEVYSGTKYEITGLEAATVYDVIVTSVNANGSSLPELTLLLITEGISVTPVTTFNETECCMEQGVYGSCLQLCVHEFRMSDQSLPLAFNCTSAVTPMLLCGTDGRDHRVCCKRKNVPSNCLGLCNLQPGVTPSISFIECIPYRSSFSECFDEGKAVLPRSPEEVEVKKIEQYSIILDWKPPGGPNITSYTVEYSMDNRYWMKQLSTNHTYYAVKDLKPDTVYYFRVTSINEKGQSTPSNTIVAYTSAVPSDKTEEEWMQLWHDREECCSKSNISSDCQSSCLSGVREDLDTKNCYNDIDKIIACGADGRDHSQCCRKKIPGFSPECMHYCQGQPGSRDITAALCLKFLGPILSCFTEGQGLLPTPPQYVKAAVKSSTDIIMKWTHPASNCNSSCFYVTYIWEDSNKQAVNKSRTKLNTYTFSNLKPMTTYRVAVGSYNKNGMSLPSPYIIITTQADSPHTVSVSQAPSGVVDSGTSVQLECVGLGAELDSVKWIRNRQLVSQENLYIIKELSSDNQGLYSCQVTFVDGKVIRDELYLNVRYKPVAKKMTEKTVLPGVNQDAKLICEFEGFPDIVTWSKDGNTLQGGAKYNMPTLRTDLVTGKTTSALTVKNVVSDDFGSYTCSGSNKFGEMHSTGNLRNMFPVTPVPTSAPPNKTDVADCCRSKGVPPDCSRQICTYDIDINNIFSNSALTHCANYLTDFFSCAADGKDHSKCCTKQGVTEACLPFCAGVIPEHDNQLELLVCLPHANILINCAIQGAHYIPSPPRNVHVQQMYDTVKVFWDVPEQNADKVDVYHVYYRSKSVEETFDAASKLSRSKALQPELIKKGETYTVWVKAINDFGSSNMSDHATITITGLVPPAPGNLQGKALPDDIIEVTWDPPNTQLHIKSYALHYQPLGGKERIVNPIKTSTRLIGLMPKTRYIISVAAVSADGEGKRTNTITIKTVESTSPLTVTPEPQTSNRTVGVVVGVVLGLIFLVAIAVVAVLLFRRLGRSKSTQNQTVAFENPHYATGQRVTGLPGESETNSFQYGKLNEEQDREHSYMTLDNTHTSSTDTPATLDLDQA